MEEVKARFDRDAIRDKHTQEYKQWFEDDAVGEKEEEKKKEEEKGAAAAASQGDNSQDEEHTPCCSVEAWIFRRKMIWRAMALFPCSWLLDLLRHSLSSVMPYSLSVIITIVVATVWEAVVLFGTILFFVISILRHIRDFCLGRRYAASKRHDDPVHEAINNDKCFSLINYCKMEEGKKGDEIAKGSTREYLIIDYNAWEFQESNKLWTALIHKIYNKTEDRFMKQKFYAKSPQYKRRVKEEKKEEEEKEEEHVNSCWTCIKTYLAPFFVDDEFLDYKRQWRIEQAQKKLEIQYGGKNGLRAIVLFSVVTILSILASAVLSIMNIIPLQRAWETGTQTASATVAAAVGMVSALAASAQFLYSNSKASGSQGEAILAKAKNIKVRDDLGFISSVRNEIDQLFSFMKVR